MRRLFAAPTTVGQPYELTPPTGARRALTWAVRCTGPAIVAAEGAVFGEEEAAQADWVHNSQNERESTGRRERI